MLIARLLASRKASSPDESMNVRSRRSRTIVETPLPSKGAKFSLRIGTVDFRVHAGLAQVTGRGLDHCFVFHTGGRPLRCSTCSNPRVAEVNTLLQANAPVRQVARLTGIPRTNLTRHARHIAPASRPFGVIRGRDDPDGPADPLAEAFKLAEQARTPRERLRALEQVRSSVKLKLRGVRDLDRDDRDLLDAGIAQAMAAYRAAPDFETAARGLSGLREAIPSPVGRRGGRGRDPD